MVRLGKGSLVDRSGSLYPFARSVVTVASEQECDPLRLGPYAPKEGQKLLPTPDARGNSLANHRNEDPN